MIEVFKTDVDTAAKADQVVQLIQRHFIQYKANFDLDDCDRILRISHAGWISPEQVIMLLKEHGVNAEILSDKIPELLPHPQNP